MTDQELVRLALDMRKHSYVPYSRFPVGAALLCDDGCRLYIDDEPAKAEDMERIFEIQEDGSFYMGDYVGADTGRLKEIRFNKVYYK